MAQITTTTSSEPKSPAYESLLNTMQRILSFAAVFAAIGFIVTTSILGHKTSLTSYAVYPQEYIVWGVTYTISFITTVLLPTVTLIMLLGCLVGIGFTKWTTGKFEILKTTKLVLGETWNFLSDSRSFLAWIGLTFLLIAFVPDQVLPKVSNPTPKTITVIFREPIDSAIWHLSTIDKQPKSSQPLILLAEYTDGMLVQDIATGAVVNVKNDMIAAIIDNATVPSPKPNSTMSP